MSDTTEPDIDQQRAFLSSLGLDPTSPTLAPAKAKKDKASIQLAPGDADPHTMPVTDIVFDERLLDDFQNLSGPGLAAASRHVFALYQSHGRDKDRNSLLHRRVTEFIGQVRRSRETGGFVRDKINADKDTRALAQVLAKHNITAAELAAMLEEGK